MSERYNGGAVADLKQANAELKESLHKCRVLLEECRSKLAANSNDTPVAEKAERALEG